MSNTINRSNSIHRDKRDRIQTIHRTKKDRGGFFDFPVGPETMKTMFLERVSTDDSEDELSKAPEASDTLPASKKGDPVEPVAQEASKKRKTDEGQSVTSSWRIPFYQNPFARQVVSVAVSCLSENDAFWAAAMTCLIAGSNFLKYRSAADRLDHLEAKQVIVMAEHQKVKASLVDFVDETITVELYQKQKFSDVLFVLVRFDLDLLLSP